MPRVRTVVCALGFCALGLVGSVPVHADMATGTVRGSVQLLRRSLLGGLKPSDDASGIIVYLTGFTQPAPAEPALLNQHNERFEPRLLPIVQGQEVIFPNHDRIYHNVFSTSPIATFDLGQYKSTDPPRTVPFSQPGLVPVYCNIHPQMLSYVVVLQNRAFAVTGADGRFAIEHVPAGTLALQAWAPGAPRVTRALELAAGQVLEVDLVVEQTERIAPHKRKDGSDYPKPGYAEE